MATIGKAVLIILVAAAIAAPASAQRRLPTYEQCYQLGLARGFIVSVGDWRNFEQFIKECMAGRVPF